MLIFEQFDAFDQARLALRSPSCVSYGDETGPVAIAPYGSHRFVRVAGATRGGAGCLFAGAGRLGEPRSFANGDDPVWAPADPHGPADAQASFYGEQIRAGLAAVNPDVLVLDRDFETQSVDPMFLEPESGLGWYDAGRKHLSSCSACSRRRRRRNRSLIWWATRGLLSSRRASTPSLPIWVAASAGAIIRSCRFILRSPRCSFPIGRCGSRSIATNSFSRVSSVTPSGCTRGSASIARPAGSAASPPITFSTAAGLPISRAGR